MNPRVERTAPAAAQDLDGLHWIGPAGQSPQNVKRIGRIDILIDHDYVTAKVCAGMDLGSNQHRLASMTRIALFDRYDIEQPSTAGLMTPNASHVRNTGLF